MRVARFPALFKGHTHSQQHRDWIKEPRSKEARVLPRCYVCVCGGPFTRARYPLGIPRFSRDKNKRWYREWHATHSHTVRLQCGSPLILLLFPLCLFGSSILLRCTFARSRHDQSSARAFCARLYLRARARAEHSPFHWKALSLDVWYCI